jgi:hypothetical protein
MATTPTIGEDTEQSTTIGSTEPEKKSSPGKESIVLAVPGKALFNNRSVIISTVIINGDKFPAGKTTIPIREGDSVSFIGSGLRQFKKVGFASNQQSSNIESFLKTSADVDGSFGFTVPDNLGSFFAVGSHAFLKLIDSSNAEIIISPYVTYNIKKEEETEEQKGKRKEEEREKSQRDGGVGGRILDQVLKQSISGAPVGFVDGLTGEVSKLAAKNPVTPNAKSVSEDNKQDDQTSDDDNLLNDSGGAFEEVSVTDSNEPLVVSSTVESVAGGAEVISQTGTVEQNISDIVSEGSTSAVSSGNLSSGTTENIQSSVAPSALVGAQVNRQTVSSGATVSSTGSANLNVTTSGAVSTEQGSQSVSTSTTFEGDAPSKVGKTTTSASSGMPVDNTASTISVSGEIPKNQNSQGTSTLNYNLNTFQNVSATPTGAMPKAQAVGQVDAENQPASIPKENAPENKSSQNSTEEKQSVDGEITAETDPEKKGQGPSMDNQQPQQDQVGKSQNAPEEASAKNDTTSKPEKAIKADSNFEKEAQDSESKTPPGVSKLLNNFKKGEKELGNKLNFPQRESGQSSQKPRVGGGRTTTPILPTGVDSANKKTEKDQESSGQSSTESPNVSQNTKQKENALLSDASSNNQQSPISAPHQTEKSKKEKDDDQETGEGPDDDGADQEQSALQQEQLANQNQISLKASQKKKSLDKATKTAIEIINTSLNSALMAGVGWVAFFTWATLGTALIPAAFLADAILIFKSPVIRFFVNRVLGASYPEIKDKALEITEEIKFSREVKVSVFFINLGAVLVILIIIVIVVAVLKSLCDGAITGSAIYLSGHDEVCKAIGQIVNSSSSKAGGG